MKFKDLPPYDSIVKMVHKYYGRTHSLGPIYLKYLNNSFMRSNLGYLDKSYIGHKTLEASYYFLERNKELEVSDEFFGNSFPFLNLTSIPVPSKSKKSFIIFLGHNYKGNDHLLYNEVCDFIYDKKIRSIHEDLNRFVLESNQKGLHISKSKGLNCPKGNRVSDIVEFYFATKTYDELMDRFNVVNIMNI